MDELCVPGLLEHQYGFASHVPVSQMNFKVMHWGEQEVRRTGKSCQAVLHQVESQQGLEPAESCQNIVVAVSAWVAYIGAGFMALRFRILKLLCHLSWSA